MEAFSPAHKGPQALENLLFGRANRWGKLPVTIYPAEYARGIESTPSQSPPAAGIAITAARRGTFGAEGRGVYHTVRCRPVMVPSLHAHAPAMPLCLPGRFASRQLQ